MGESPGWIRGLIDAASLATIVTIMSLSLLSRILCLLVLLSFTRSAGAITLGQVDTFQGIANPAEVNWRNGANTVALVPSGGPAGAGDAYMQLSADGGGQGGRLVAQTYTVPPSFTSQWTGNYIGAGVTAIEFDLLNQSAVTLSIRIAFKTDTGQASSGYLSLQRAVLAPGSGWQHFSIQITPTMLAAIGGPAAYNTFFQNGFVEMRIINEAGTTNLNGDPVVGMLGIDNIRAIPEPTVTALAAAGLFLLGALWLRRRRCAA